MKEYKVEGHVSSFLPDDKNWKLVWNDEFDGPELDTDKWFYRLYMRGKRHSVYVEDAISFDNNSNIIFHLIEKDGKYYSSTLQTGENYTDRPNGESKNIKPKFMHKYGYYEVRCRMQQKDPWWTAFWLQSPIVTENLPPEKAGIEVDIMESFTPNTYIPHFNHWGGYDEEHQFANTMGENRYAEKRDEIFLKDTENDYHTFAVDWSEDGYTFYVDGKQSGKKITGPVSDTEQFILLFTECKGLRSVPNYTIGDFIQKGENDSFVVDYVRVFEEIKGE